MHYFFYVFFPPLKKNEEGKRGLGVEMGLLQHYWMPGCVCSFANLNSLVCLDNCARGHHDAFFFFIFSFSGSLFILSVTFIKLKAYVLFFPF